MRRNKRKLILAQGVNKFLGESFFEKPEKNSFNPQFVEDCYQYGGKKFVQELTKYGINERGEKLNLLEWHCEYAEFIGDFRVAETLTSGCSQVGKTLFHSLLLSYCLTNGGLNTLWSYDLQLSRDIQVPSNFRPVIERWMKAKGIKKVNNDAKNNTIYQVSGATAQFVYVSTSKVKEGEGSAAAGGIAVGVSRDILFKEERSQYPPGAADPLNRRLDAGRLPSRPIRELGTPGGGNGIEAEIEVADYQFYPHYKCSVCGVSAPLHPKGCLLKKYQGEYLSKTGRPLNWHVDDDNKTVFACSNCGAYLNDETRKSAYFKCLKTGITLREFLDKLPFEEPSERIKAGIILSPLLRIRSPSLPSEMVEEGLNTFNTEDWQQQVLGLPSESNSTAVTLEMFKVAIGKPRITTKADITIAGGDQGRSEDWLWVCEYYLPKDDNLSIAQIIEQTTRHVLFGGDIMRGEVPDTLKYLGVNFGLYDNEPDRSSIAQLCDVTCLEMADQKTGLVDAVSEGIVRDGGSEYPCWKIRNEKFLKQVLSSFLLEKFHLPPEWEKWVGNKSERSPMLHLTSPSFNPATGKWKRGKNNLDDLYYAAMFCEAAFFIWMTQKNQKSGFEKWSDLTKR